ncbi:MAG: Bifunctional NAD(P)H-hydrate repair enzyme Nnr [Verrucomicrobiota bacterium]
MLLTRQQMKEAEQAAFSRGSTPEELMEIAGEGIARCIRQFFPNPRTLLVYCGKGHNGGDALVAARHLCSCGWRVQVRCPFSPDELAPLTHRHLKQIEVVEPGADLTQVAGTLILLDGLLGIGATGTPRGAISGQIEEMNRIRLEHGGFIVAVDLPSGLDATTGAVAKPCVQADLTVTLGAVKTGLAADSATAVVGRLALVPLPGISFTEGDPAVLSTAHELRSLLPVRDFDTHKGSYGRIGIVAGSPGFLGAARLCSTAAVHAGGGLVTLYTTAECHDLLASTCIPEVMVRRVNSYAEVLRERHDVLAIGPGLGREHDMELRELVSNAPIPCVVDADALNAVATDPSLLGACAGPRLLTPHPGEMERLFPQAVRMRREWAVDFVKHYPVTLLLKGARTIIAQGGYPSAFNQTGNPGMGSGGMGDVLTGVCAALLAAGQSPRDAAMLSAWLCGRAAEIAVFNGVDSEESLSATSVIAHMGAAFSSLRMDDY